MGLIIILVLGLLAGAVSGVLGTGASIIILPVLSAIYGPQEAIPIMAVASVMANFARILAWWRHVAWKVVMAYSMPGMGGAYLGANFLLVLPTRAIDLAIGLFLLIMIPLRRLLPQVIGQIGYIQLALAGAVIGFLTGIVVSTGPLSVPVFLGFGLVKGMFIGTEAASSMLIYFVKVLTFQGVGALSAIDFMRGLCVGAALMVGTFLSKPFLLHLSSDKFRMIMDALLFVAGCSFILN